MSSNVANYMVNWNEMEDELKNIFSVLMPKSTTGIPDLLRYKKQVSIPPIVNRFLIYDSKKESRDLLEISLVLNGGYYYDNTYIIVCNGIEHYVPPMGNEINLKFTSPIVHGSDFKIYYNNVSGHSVACIAFMNALQ